MQVCSREGERARENQSAVVVSRERSTHKMFNYFGMEGRMYVSGETFFFL